jgi:hypothetical protein
VHVQGKGIGGGGGGEEFTKKHTSKKATWATSELSTRGGYLGHDASEYYE